jgi:hypothetical protein
MAGRCGVRGDGGGFGEQTQTSGGREFDRRERFALPAATGVDQLLRRPYVTKTTAPAAVVGSRTRVKAKLNICHFLILRVISWSLKAGWSYESTMSAARMHDIRALLQKRRSQREERQTANAAQRTGGRMGRHDTGVPTAIVGGSETGRAPAGVAIAPELAS